MGLLSLLNNKMYVSIDEVLSAIKLHINDNSSFYSEHKILLEVLQQSEIEVFEQDSGLWGL